jgi:hypothetical protein
MEISGAAYLIGVPVRATPPRSADRTPASLDLSKHRT